MALNLNLRYIFKHLVSGIPVIIIELQVNWNDNSVGEIEASLIQFF